MQTVFYRSATSYMSLHPSFRKGAYAASHRICAPERRFRDRAFRKRKTASTVRSRPDAWKDPKRHGIGELTPRCPSEFHRPSERPNPAAVLRPSPRGPCFRAKRACGCRAALPLQTARPRDRCSRSETRNDDRNRSCSRTASAPPYRQLNSKEPYRHSDSSRRRTALSASRTARSSEPF